MVTKEEVMKQMETVIDPELGVNIVDLGLIYEVNIEGTKAEVKMTMTTPFCPVAPQIISSAKSVLQKMGLEGTVELVWSPPWTPEKMSEKARFELGMI